MDFVQLRTFLAIYRAGSVTAGARLAGLSQPAATAQLGSLERRLGRRLFDRLPRGVAPTPVADELAARLAGPIDALEVIAAGAPPVGDTPAPPVHLGGPADGLTELVIGTVEPLVAQGIRLRLGVGLADDLLADLRAGAYDLVISAVRPRGRTVAAEPLMDEEFVLVAAPALSARLDLDRLAAHGPAALSGVPLISYAEDLPILRRFWRHVFGIRLDAAPAIVFPDLRGVRTAVVAGAGLSVLPRHLCRRELADGALVALLDSDDPPINTIYLARRTGPAHPHVVTVHDHLISAARTW